MAAIEILDSPLDSIDVIFKGIRAISSLASNSSVNGRLKHDLTHIMNQVTSISFERPLP